jgi:hypothetical protein
MPVVINDFEVVPSAPAAAENGAASPEQGGKSGEKEKPSFENRLQHWRERTERVRAH